MNNPSNIEIALFDGTKEAYRISYLKSFSFNRSVFTPSGSISFTIPKLKEKLYDKKVIETAKIGNMVRAYIDERLVFTGYITALNSKHDSNSSDVQFDCKDVIWRLQRAQLNHLRTGLNGNLPLDKIVSWALSGLETVDNKGFPKGFDDDDWFNLAVIKYNQADMIKVTGKPVMKDLTNDFESTKEADVKPKQNETIYDFLKRLVRPFGYILQADNEGNLVFFRPNVKDDLRFIFDCEIMNPSLELSLDDLHSSYMVYSNHSNAKKGTTRNAYEHINPYYPELAPKNTLLIYDENMKSVAQCEKMAKRKCGFDLAKYWKYSFEVSGLNYDGILYWNDVNISVNDLENEVKDELYVSEIEFNVDPNRQSTKMVCTLKYALLLE